MQLRYLSRKTQEEKGIKNNAYYVFNDKWMWGKRERVMKKWTDKYKKRSITEWMKFKYSTLYVWYISESHQSVPLLFEYNHTHSSLAYNSSSISKSVIKKMWSKFFILKHTFEHG